MMGLAKQLDVVVHDSGEDRAGSVEQVEYSSSPPTRTERAAASRILDCAS